MLALALLARANSSNAFAALVGDDRIFVRNAGGRLIARGAANIAGLIERRTVGLTKVRSEPAAVMRLAVELCEPERRWPRMPDHDDDLIIADAALPRLALDSSLSICDQALAIEERLAVLRTRPAARLGISLEHCAAVHKNEVPEHLPPA